MEPEVISKKELLELTGISYGQLYRWKRKNLIPEDWFIRKSTFTGQETFFPKEQILARIDKIKNMKDDLSLDALADMFSPNPAETTLPKKEITERNIVSKLTLDYFIHHQGDAEEFSFQQILYAFLLEKLLQTGEMSLDEGKILLKTLADHFPKYEGRSCELIFIRKMGVPLFLLTVIPNEIYLDLGAKIIVRLSLAGCTEELKIKLS